ncbi:hypothetical protein IWW36_004231 [Coemansia brasiliensis]|uniref:Uncharacterized protein n=1 Tax=Coemansia brasiliensis TaxID=2650707 RepID=A0A9W8I3Q4_9FUNG|nr:hypothetical protein IWW36_004231 [Coemansia brasiliensis]
MNILEKQRFYQVMFLLEMVEVTGHEPIYMRTPMSRFMFRSVIGLVLGGGLYGAFNLGKLILGKKP